jgi:two-component system response regulator FixJ
MSGASIIHVVEDDASMRASLVEMLEYAGYSVKSYNTAEQLLAFGADLEPGCVIADVRMPGMDGLALLRRLRERGNGIPLMLITCQGDISMAVTAMKSGAVDFLEKPFEAEALLVAVSEALRVRAGHIDRAEAEAARLLAQKLTSREQEVLEHLVAGRSNKEIAAQLGISPRTVEFHRNHVMEKMAAKGLPDLVRLWFVVRNLQLVD